MRVGEPGQQSGGEDGVVRSPRPVISIRASTRMSLEPPAEWAPLTVSEPPGNPPAGWKAKGTLNWGSAPPGLKAGARLYDTLFTQSDPMDVPEGQDWKALLNPASLEVIAQARLEPSLAGAQPGQRFQFERTGYFSVDPDSQPGALVLNQTVGLKDSWAKIEARQ